MTDSNEKRGSPMTGAWRDEDRISEAVHDSFESQFDQKTEDKLAE
jgi:hypothetical protein